MTRTKEDQKYYLDVGGRISQLRKRRGMTQGELATSVGLSQQAIHAYESADRWIPMVRVIKLATVLKSSVEEIMGTKAIPKQPSRRLSPRAARNAERLQQLSKTQQRFVVRIISNFLDTPRLAHRQAA